MKFSALFTIVLAQEESSNGTAVEERGRPNAPAAQDQSKRYSQLVEMMGNYNAAFDERKYWTYGCNCLILGDRPMSDPGHGKPVDELDTVCKAYKDCLKCARLIYFFKIFMPNYWQTGDKIRLRWQFGDMCIGEFVKYKFSINKSGNARCKSDAGSCERALCECDRQFAIDHAAATGVYTDDFHAFWAPNGWDPEGQCMKGGNGQNDPQCCGGNNAPYVSY